MSDKTMDEWLRDNPVALANMMRGQIVASHTIIMEELRTLHGKPFDLAEEVNRLSDRATNLAAFFDMSYEQAVAARLKEKRVARRRQQMQPVPTGNIQQPDQES